MDPRFLAEALTRVSLPGQVAVLILLLGCAAWAVLRPGPLPVVGLAGCAAVWLRANSHLEGVVLLSFGPGRGLTLADLLVPALGCGILLRRSRAAIAEAPVAADPDRSPVPPTADPSAAPSGETGPSRTAEDRPAAPAIPSPRSNPEPARPVRR